MVQKVSLTTAFQLKKIANTVDNELQLYETTRQAALLKFCELNSDGELDTDDKGVVKFKSDDDQKQFGEELKELLDQDIDLGKVSATALDKVELSANDLMMLSDLITE